MPGDAKVLEVGCGDGLAANLLALCSPERAVTGVDVDPTRAERAGRVARRMDQGDRVRTQAVAPGWRPTGRYDAIVAVDVLYLLPDRERAGLLSALTGSLTAGGRLVVKETGDEPKWKARLVTAEERLATSRWGWTRAGGRWSGMPSADWMASVMAEAGLRTTVTPCHHGYPASHVLVVGDANGPPAR